MRNSASHLEHPEIGTPGLLAQAGGENKSPVQTAGTGLKRSVEVLAGSEPVLASASNGGKHHQKMGCSLKSGSKVAAQQIIASENQRVPTLN